MHKSKVEQITVIALMVCLLMVAAISPAMGAILVQNYTEWTMYVEEPPISKELGADPLYDDADAVNTGYLRVNLGGTITNTDDTDNTPGTNPVLLSHEEISFTCFAGDRTYYTDVIQLVNNAAENWNVTLTIEPDLTALESDNVTTDTDGIEHNFTDLSGDDGTADIWLFASSINSAGSAVTETPNPANYSALTEWQNGTGTGGVIQLEYNDTSAGVGTAPTDFSVINGTTGPFSVPTGEQRQLALVVDCSATMADEIEPGGGAANTTYFEGQTATFRMTVAASPV